MPGQAVVAINDNQWTCSVANTYAELEWGLSGVPSMPAGTGMLFVLPTDRSVSVTTEPMLFNIDIIFISSGLEVVDVAKNVTPGNIVTEGTPVRYFLEVNAGEAADIESGDMVGIAVYQLATPLTDWISPLVSFAGLVAVGAFMVGMAREVTQAILGKPKERLKLLPQTTGKPTREDVTVDSWVERDRIGIWVTDNRTGETIAEWWDNEAREMFEQGFFKEADYTRHQKLIGRDFEESVKDYLEGLDVLASAGVEYLPQTKTTELNGLRITKAYKQISRHGENEISVSLLAWGVFPKGRRPHMISMYRSGDEYILSPLYGHVAHWVHVPVSKVKAWIRSLPIRHFEPMAVAPEYREKAEELARSVDEPIEILPLTTSEKGGQPAVIPTKPRPRRETDLEYLADTPEYLTQTIDATGYRDKLDSTFQEAIARAKGLK